MHIYASVNYTIIGSDNGLLPGRHQAIIWTNAGISITRPLRTNFSDILIEIYTFSFKKMHSKILSEKCWPLCLGLNVSMLQWETLHKATNLQIMILHAVFVKLTIFWSVTVLMAASGAVGCDPVFHAVLCTSSILWVRLFNAGMHSQSNWLMRWSHDTKSSFMIWNKAINVVLTHWPLGDVAVILNW